jgi:restriction system protein
MLALLEHTADGEIHTARELKEILADHFGITPEERQHMLPSGQQTTFHNRVAWAKAYLERAGILKNVRRGHFTIADRGREIPSFFRGTN